MKLDKLRERRFWSYVDKSGGPNACWLWTKAKMTGQRSCNGYGMFWLNEVKNNVRAHRLAYMLYYRVTLLDKAQVCHDCPNGDNPSCCNPKHLWVGTQGDNNRDCINKGRGNRKTPDTKGENNPRAKTTERVVITVRKHLKNKTMTAKELRAKYNLSYGQLLCIRNYTTWRHIP